MDVIYIGLPFVFWQEDESKHGLDIHVTEGFQKIGFHVYPLNAGDNAEEICAASPCCIFRKRRRRQKMNIHSSSSIRRNWLGKTDSSWRQKLPNATRMKTIPILGGLWRPSFGLTGISCRRAVRSVPSDWQSERELPCPTATKSGTMTSKLSAKCLFLIFSRDS